MRIHFNQMTGVMFAGAALVASACSSAPTKKTETTTTEQASHREQRVASNPNPSANTNMNANTGFGNPGIKEGETAYRSQEVIIREHKIPTVTMSQTKGDLNRMEEEHFRALGFSEDLAKKAVEYRDEHKGYHSVAELKNIEGMTPQLFNRVKNSLAVGPTG